MAARPEQTPETSVEVMAVMEGGHGVGLDQGVPRTWGK